MKIRGAASIQISLISLDSNILITFQADVQSRRGHVRGCCRLPGVHRVPGAVLPVLSDRRAALHPASAAHYHDSRK